MQFTPKFQKIPLLLGLESKTDQPQQQGHPYSPFTKSTAESEHTSPNYKTKLTPNVSPYHQKKETYGFNLTPKNIPSKPSYDSLDNFSAYMMTEQSPMKTNQPTGTFSETAKKVMQNTGNAIAYGLSDIMETPKKTNKVPKFENFQEAYTSRPNNPKEEFATIISRVKENPQTDRIFGRSNSHNIEINYGMGIDDLKVGKEAGQSRRDIFNESSTKLPRFNSDSPKKKKGVTFKERIVDTPFNDMPPISFNEDDNNEILIGFSKVKTKFDQHEYLGINLPTIGSNAPNSSSLMLMKLFRKK